MIFEEALSKMRKGKKIRHPMMEPDEYFIACRIGLKFGNEKPTSEWPISISKMKGEYLHPDMGAGSLDKLPKDWDKPPCKHGNFPQINLLYIMSDEWMVFE